MTLATLGPVSSNFVVSGFALTVVLAFVISAILWKHDVQTDRHEDAIAAHDEQLATLAYQMPALLEYLGVEIAPPVEDDSPEAMADVDQATAEWDLGDRAVAPDDAPTDEFPIVQPDTSPMPLVVEPTPAVQARRDAAWDQQRPSPVPRELIDPETAEKRRQERAALVEEQLKRFDFSGRNR